MYIRRHGHANTANNLRKSHNSVNYMCWCCPTRDTPNPRSVRGPDYIVSILTMQFIKQIHAATKSKIKQHLHETKTFL